MAKRERERERERERTSRTTEQLNRHTNMSKDRKLEITYTGV